MFVSVKYTFCLHLSLRVKKENGINNYVALAGFVQWLESQLVDLEVSGSILVKGRYFSWRFHLAQEATSRVCLTSMFPSFCLPLPSTL